LDELLLLPVGYLGYATWRKGKEFFMSKTEKGYQRDLFDRNRYRPTVVKAEKTGKAVGHGVLAAHHFMERTTDKVMNKLMLKGMLTVVQVKYGVIPKVKEACFDVKVLVRPHPVEMEPDDARTECIEILEGKPFVPVLQWNPDDEVFTNMGPLHF
jgi:hypothetical protein